MRRLSYTFVLVTTLFVLFDIRPAAAQPPDSELGETAAFLQLFPELRVLPAPTWFVPGVRSSYETSSATIGGNVSGAGITQYDVVAARGVAITAFYHTCTAGHRSGNQRANDHRAEQ